MNEIKIGVISDIHSNFDALKACLDHMEKENITEYILLGDYVSDTADTVKTMETIYDLKQKYSVSMLRGNREEYMLDQWYIRNGKKEGPIWPANSASGNLLYTYEQLTEKDFQFFDSLPITFRYEKEGFPAITCCHGSPDNSRELLELYGDNTKEWLEKIDTPYLMAAHTHFPGKLEHAGRTYLNSGCSGIAIIEHEKGVGIAQCMILHGIEKDGVKTWEPEFLSIPYDPEIVIEKIKNNGLLHMGKWFVNASLYILETGIDHNATMVRMANEAAALDTNGEAKWPFIDETYFEEAANKLGIPDYR